MPAEPPVKRAIAYFDGQNLYHHARTTFGYTHPNYDVHKLSQAVCSQRGWQLERIHFYTGIPSATENPFWHGYWSNKLASMGRTARVYGRPLVYRTKTVQIPGHGPFTYTTAEEKGIDVRLALDALDAAHQQEFDVALVFSQDQDLSELASVVRNVSALQSRWIKIASAFPDAPTGKNRRGINRTDWIPIDKATYDLCIDPRDYRP